MIMTLRELRKGCHLNLSRCTPLSSSDKRDFDDPIRSELLNVLAYHYATAGLHQLDNLLNLTHYRLPRLYLRFSHALLLGDGSTGNTVRPTRDRLANASQ
jgi:hypothetical protein